MAEETFYTEICNATTIDQEKEICAKYNKDFHDTRVCINRAMKAHMMSSSNDKALFHQWIVEQLKQENL